MPIVADNTQIRIVTLQIIILLEIRNSGILNPHFHNLIVSLCTRSATVNHGRSAGGRTADKCCSATAQKKGCQNSSRPYFYFG